MVQYIDNQNISRSEVGTAFPNLRSSKLVDLTDTPSVKDFARLDFSKNTYIFYSNVMNEFSAEELDTLKNQWQSVQILRGGQIEVILYKKK